MNESYMFLGGPRDGEKLPVVASDHIIVALPDNTEFVYARVELWGLQFYTPNDWTVRDALQHLLDTYNSSRPIDTGERFLGLPIYIERRAEKEHAIDRFKRWICECKTNGAH